jgi:hypothetical protein
MFFTRLICDGKKIHEKKAFMQLDREMLSAHQATTVAHLHENANNFPAISTACRAAIDRLSDHFRSGVPFESFPYLLCHAVIGQPLR